MSAQPQPLLPLAAPAANATVFPRPAGRHTIPAFPAMTTQLHLAVAPIQLPCKHLRGPVILLRQHPHMLRRPPLPRTSRRRRRRCRGGQPVLQLVVRRRSGSNVGVCMGKLLLQFRLVVQRVLKLLLRHHPEQALRRDRTSQCARLRHRGTLAASSHRW